MTSSTQARDGRLGWLRDFWERGWLKGWLLLIAVILVYQPAWHGKPIWDDDAHLTPPGLRSSEGSIQMRANPSDERSPGGVRWASSSQMGFPCHAGW